MRQTILLIARGLFSLTFILSGANKLINWHENVSALPQTFSEWSMHFDGSIISKHLHEFLVSKSNIILGVTIFLEIIGAVFVFLGYKLKLGAFFLLLFMVPVTLIMHPFWLSIGSEVHQELSAFLKNVSIIGALLFLLVGPHRTRE